MSKVEMKVNTNRMICQELEVFRDAIKTLDFSMVYAATERIYHHATAMEDGLYAYQTKEAKLKAKIKKLKKKLKEKEETK